MERTVCMCYAIVAAHALSGCDSVAPYHGVGKLSIIKRLKEGMKLLHMGCLNEDFGKVLEEATTLISDCYGYPDVSMTQCRIKVWYKKTPKARKKAPDLQSLPPTSEAFKENVKRAHLQAIVWYSTMEAEPPATDFTDYGWIKDELNKILAPVGLPSGISAAPDEVLNSVKCGCCSSTPCSTKRCLCVSVRDACTVMCKCRGDSSICHNEATRNLSQQNVESDEGDG